MDDLISRQAAVDALDKIFPADPMRNDYTQGIACGAALAKTYVEQLPSAQPETHEERTETHACDCIERQAVYNVLDKMPVRGFKKDGETIHGLISLSQVNSAIINLPSAQSEPKWIPCSERLPEERQEILATTTDNAWGDVVIIRTYYKEMHKSVIAWMPLPEPYREEGE